MHSCFSAVVAVRHSGHQVSLEDMETRYNALFSKEDVDGWEIRKAINDLQVGCPLFRLHFYLNILVGLSFV